MPSIRIIDNSKVLRAAFAQLKRERRSRKRLNFLFWMSTSFAALNVVETLWDLYRHQWHYFWVPLYGVLAVGVVAYSTRGHYRFYKLHVEMSRRAIHALRRMEDIRVDFDIFMGPDGPQPQARLVDSKATAALDKKKIN